MSKVEKKLTPKEVGATGGKSTLKKHGKKHFVEAGKKRWAKEKPYTPKEQKKDLKKAFESL